MGRPVTAHLRSLLTKQVDDRGIVVWFDPERHYGDVVAGLELVDTTVAAYDGSFFELRYRIRDLLKGVKPPRLVVYVPLAEEATHEALVELTAVGAVMKPGQNPWQRNTRLSVVAARALRPLLGEGRTAPLEKQIEAGLLTLDELDAMAGRDGALPPLLEPIFGARDVRELVLAFLGGDGFDARVEAKRATGELAQLLQRELGLQTPPTATCADLRAQLTRRLLCTELAAALGASAPSALGSVPVAAPGPEREECLQIVRAWRGTRDLRESYADWADRVEGELGRDVYNTDVCGTSLRFIEAIGDCETFPALDRRLQVLIEERLAAGAADAEAGSEMRALVERRLHDFWSEWPERYPGVRARWELVAVTLDLLAAADAVEFDLRRAPPEPAALIGAYTEGRAGGEPWCILDTHQRRLERLWHAFDWGADELPDSLRRATELGRRRYMAVGGDLAERFVHALQAARFNVPGIRRQAEVFDRFVAGPMATGKTAYVLVDALRFDMARELGGSLDAFDGDLHVCIGTAPTLTPVGMGALMPGAERGLELIQAGPSKLAVTIGGELVADRKARLDCLRARVPAPMAAATLGEVLGQTKPSLDRELRQASTVVVTLQEIDWLAEGDDVHLAHRLMDDMLAQLVRLVNRLQYYGCATIVMAADHGYLFADEPGDDMKIPPPGGQTVDLTRRAWVGRGGAADLACMRTPLAALGLSNDLDLVVPWGFGVFSAQGGARAYFHGGLSPQELVIPVLVLRTRGSMQPSTSDIVWSLTPGSRKVTTRFFSATVAGEATGLLDIQPPRVRLESRAGGVVISTPISASYGFDEASGDVQLDLAGDDNRTLRPNTVTLMLDVGSAKTVSLHLLDAVTGRELARISDVEVVTMDL